MEQQSIWNQIAPEWHEYKKIPAEHTIEFLKKASGKVLDLGSGSGRHLVKIKDGKMYLVDFSKEMIKLAEKRAKEKNIDAEFFVSDISKLPFENEFFDYAICISALHCVGGEQKTGNFLTNSSSYPEGHKGKSQIEGEENREKTVKEIYRVLKKGGKAEIGVWNKNSKRFKNLKAKEKYVGWTDKGKRYYYLYDEDEVHELFKKNGFKIISSHNSEMMINFVVGK